MKELPSPESSASNSRESQLTTTAQVATASDNRPALVEQRGASISDVALLHRSKLLTIQQGTATTVALGDRSAAPVQAGLLLVQLEYTVDEKGDAKSKLTCTLEWLTREDADAAKENENEYIVEVETLDGVLTIPALYLQAFCIATRGSLVRLKIGTRSIPLS